MANTFGWKCRFMRIKSLEEAPEAPYRRTKVSRPRKGRSCLNKADAKRRTQLEKV